MHYDLSARCPEVLETDVAIIGSGVAGRTVAGSLLDAGCRVVILESGGTDYEPEAADLNAGSNVGEDYYPLEDARLRFFGGTTAIWGGRCAELDPVDFERRSWVPHSGWPISYEDLRPFYEKARGVFGLPRKAPTVDDLVQAGAPLAPLNASELSYGIWTFDSQFDRFTFRRSAAIIDHPACTVVTHANVTKIAADEDYSRVQRLEAKSPAGRALHVRARLYVLAAGGIENPRLLLASNDIAKAGIGNGNDLVGRFFMEHPHGRGGAVVHGSAWHLLSMFKQRLVKGVKVAPLIHPSAEMQAREACLNSGLTIVCRKPADGRSGLVSRMYLHAKHKMAPDQTGRSLWRHSKTISKAVQQRVDPLRPWMLTKFGGRQLALSLRAEQAPNPESRVRLTRDIDAAGMPRVSLNWQTSPIDVASAAALVGALRREFSCLCLGTVEPADWLNHPRNGWHTDRLIGAHPIGGYHHMGTTRMGETATTGVADSYGRVHELKNLFIAGSSLFPTSGWANPTLTIAALALRTSEALKREIERKPQVQGGSRARA